MAPTLPKKKKNLDPLWVYAGSSHWLLRIFNAYLWSLPFLTKANGKGTNMGHSIYPKICPTKSVDLNKKI